ncbi:Ubiquitin-like protein DskB [Trichophyton interdigitale]|uniref:Ubiquitin-like protein DskB n=1 Tax=Trichophyton interdigitale TaxID=101480 RepID=A0A9P5D1S4_9EURO|nr:Ubiquitin-like protein DskB [Trichophyton interdigitale]KAF3900913.1 Ubiquitin-like protein DskB [Trichophyton interdigitale]KAG8210134.1 Ubiquitin-like protein DskB [Trichophyton interdigitale]
MAEEDAPFTFHVKSSAEPKFSLTLKPSSTVAEIKQILAGEEYANVPPERQRLIYSGRVLKDTDTLASHKVKEGHTIHLVKSAVPAGGSSSGSASASASASANTTTTASNAAGRGTQSTPSGAAGVPTNLAAGTGNSMLAGLTGARYAGFSQLPGAGMFGPDGGMGPLPDTDQILSMMENPQFQSTMNEALQNPQIIDMMIQQNPMLRDMPNARQILQSPEFRRMLTDPNMLRYMTQMQRAMGQGGGGGQSAFPAPGVTNTTQRDAGSQDSNNNNNNNNNNNQNQPQMPPFNPFLAMPGAGGNPFSFLAGMQQPPAGAASGDAGTAGSNNNNTTSSSNNQQQQQQQPNPFASLFNPALFGQPPNADGQAAQPIPNPFVQNPALFSQLMQAMGGGPGADANSNAGANANANASNPLLHSLFGGQPPQPPDNRPPEERYAEQLRQLNDMGFFEFDRNIEALRRSGGSVQGAVEYLLNSP